jgi:hypothetical protein
MQRAEKLGLGIFVAVVVLASSNLVIAADPPQKMIHAIIQMSGSDITSDSFSAKPKTFWRAANKYCRVDEEPDAANGIHGRLVVDEPDAWLINLQDNTAKHLLDHGPTFNCKLPIFAFDQEMAKSKIGSLEVGHELEFFRENGATRIDGPKLQFEANYYALDIDGWGLRLVERVDIHAPIMIGLMRGEKLYQARYLLWEEVPFDPQLFAKPADVKVQEVK